MTRTHTRSLCGTRARGYAPRNRGDNVSIVSALTLSGPLTTMHIPGAINGDAFLLYLVDFLVPALWPDAVVVMDNPERSQASSVCARRSRPPGPVWFAATLQPGLQPV